MQITKISSFQSFKAKVEIQAPGSLLSKKDKDEIEKFAAPIGSSSDMFGFSVSALYSKDNKNNVLLYDITSDKFINGTLTHSKTTIPYFENGKMNKALAPKSYIMKILSRYQNKDLD